MNKKIIFGVVFLVLIVGGIFLLNNKENPQITLINEKITNEKEQFIPKMNIIGEREEEGNRIFEFDGGYEVNELMYLNYNNEDGIYSSFSDDILNEDKTRTFISYNSPKNVYEDGGWKRIENARSLKDKGFNIGTTEYDVKYGYEIIDFNLTSIEFKPIINDNEYIGINVPIKRNGEIRGNVNYENRNQREIIEFNNINLLKDNFTIGGNSTTFSMNGTGGNGAIASNNRGSLDFNNVPSGQSAGWRVDGYIFRTLANFNLTQLPVGMEVLRANISFFKNADFTDFKENYTFMGKNGTFGDTNIDTNGDYPINFTGWQTGNTIYDGINVTELMNTSLLNLKANEYFNVSISSDGRTQIESSAGDSFKLMLMDYERDIEAKGVPSASHSIGLGDTFDQAPFLTVTYQPPSTPINMNLKNLMLNSTNATNLTSENLFVSFTPEGNNTATALFTNISFYNHSILHSSYNSLALTNGTYFELQFDSANLSERGIWYATINVTDSEGYHNFTTFNLSISQAPPSTPNLQLPINNTFTANYSIILSCDGSTDDNTANDAINYEFYVEREVNPPTILWQNYTNTTATNTSIELDGTYWWGCKANDNQSVSSFSEIRSFVVDRRFIKDTTETFNTQVVESSSQSFMMNLTYNNLTVSDITAVFNYNNTNYTTTKTDESNNRFSFKSEVIIPIVETTPLVKGFGWNFTITQLNETISLNNSYINTQTIIGLVLTNCTEGNRTLNFLIKDEDNPSNFLNSTLELEIEYWRGSSLVSKKYNDELTGNYNYTLCLSNVDNTTYANAYIKNTVDEVFTHRYYFYNNSLTNNTQYIDLYNFNLSAGKSDLKITVRNKETYDFFENIVTKLQRRYLEEGIWRTIQMDESGDFGLNFFNIIEENTDYRLLFSNTQNNLLKTSDQMKFICTAGLCELTFLLDPTIGGGVAQQLVYDLSYNNETGIITLTWNDPVGATSLMRLHVTKETMTGTAEICNPSSAGASGTLTCDTSAYTGEVYVRVFDSASPEEPTATTWIKLVTSQLGNVLTTKDSVFWSVGIMVTIVGFGMIISPVAAVITTILGLITLLFLGLFTPLTITFVIIASILGIVIGVRVRR